MALIYTSPALVLFALSMAILWTVLEIYVLVLRFFLLGKIKIPIGITDPGKTASIQLLLRNNCFFSIKKIRICLEIKNSFENRKRKIWLKASELNRGENRVTYVFSFPEAGNYEFYLCRLRYYDPLGLLRGSARLDSRKNLQVLPEIVPVPVTLTDKTRNFFGDADVYDEEKAGHDNSELFQIRPYRVGDRPQTIHWKLSAKENELMVKESSLPKACSVILILEEGRSYWRNGYRFHKFLETASSLSYSLMDAGCPHYVVWYEERSRDVTRIRVDDEESYYQFLAWYLTEQGKEKPKDLLQRYRDKYRGEPFVASLTLTGDLKIFRDGDLITGLSPDDYKKELEETEFVF